MGGDFDSNPDPDSTSQSTCRGAITDPGPSGFFSAVIYSDAPTGIRLVGDVVSRKDSNLHHKAVGVPPPHTVLGHLGKIRSVDHLLDVPLCPGRGALGYTL